MKQSDEPVGSGKQKQLLQAALPVAGQSRRGPRMVSASLAAMLLVPLAANAQSQITPGAPLVPLRPQALANGVGNRITYQYNTEFVTIGAIGNVAWTSPPNISDNMRGFGSVNYEYRIGRTEITTSQWCSLLSAAMGRSSSQRLPWLSLPSSWAGDVDPTYDGPGVHYRAIPGRENFGVGDVSWRAAAMYCNWLHNG